jgi:uncharacterized spore protein YtfJ
MAQEFSEASVLENVGNLIGSKVGVTLAFGAPVERESATVVPVARVRYGFGGGSGQKLNEEQAGKQSGGGGGGGVVVQPAGFLILRGDQVRYQPIRDPVRIAAVIFAIAFGLSWPLRALLRAYR